jgi:hypothetical protein
MLSGLTAAGYFRAACARHRAFAQVANWREQAAEYPITFGNVLNEVER